MQETTLSEAQQQIDMLRESAADFVGRTTDMKRLRERRGTLPGYDPAQFRQMAELGWLGIVVPEEHGGLGLGFNEMAVVLQELGKGLMAGPMVATVLAARAHVGDKCRPATLDRVDLFRRRVRSPTRASR